MHTQQRIHSYAYTCLPKHGVYHKHVKSLNEAGFILWGDYQSTGSSRKMLWLTPPVTADEGIIPVILLIYITVDVLHPPFLFWALPLPTYAPTKRGNLCMCVCVSMWMLMYVLIRCVYVRVYTYVYMFIRVSACVWISSLDRSRNLSFNGSLLHVPKPNLLTLHHTTTLPPQLSTSFLEQKPKLPCTTSTRA